MIIELEKRRVKRRSPSVTPEMAKQIKRMVGDLGMLQHDVAAHFGINQGRVSEVMNGRYDRSSDAA